MKLLVVLTCLLFSFALAQALYPNALALLEAQGDFTVITTLVRRDPDLTNLLQTAKDITFFAAPDSTFPPDIRDSPVFNNITFVNAIIKQLTLEGIHPTSDFTSRPQYFNSKLTDPDYVNLSRGAAVGRLVKLNGRNNFRVGEGTSANIIDSRANLQFDGGIVQVTDAPVNAPEAIQNTFLAAISPVAPNYSIGNATALGLLDSLASTKDVTLFALTNEAFGAALQEFLTSTTCPSESLLQSLEYYAITPGVYYADSFTGRKVRTLNGESVTLSGVKRFPAGLRVNDAKVVVPDIFVKNGVVHVIDRTISPK